MTPTQKYDLLVKSTIIRSEKANKGLDATAAPNPNQMNRLKGFLPDGTEVVIAQRPGRGGMDFNKLLGGKVFAVAADGMSPVYEKDKDNKPTKVQKTEDGLPLYSSSGFYLLSSKEYPALDMFEAFTHLQGRGAQVLLLTPAQLAAKQQFALTSELDLEILQGEFEAALDHGHNLVSRFDEAMNRKRKRAIDNAQGEAEENGEDYAGVQFKEVGVSPKDGNPFIRFAWRVKGEQTIHTGNILREGLTLDDNDREVTVYFDAKQALERFTASAEYRKLVAVLDEGKEIDFAFAKGHVMRTSVSFRRKVENVMAASPDKALYGDAVYIHAAQQAWTKGLVALMHSQHPNFPNADYDAHHYVAACRQAEVGMSKKPDNSGWTPPKGVGYDLDTELLR